MKKLLRVEFQDGTVICRDKVTDTYIDSLAIIGLPSVNALKISARDRRFVNLVSETPDGVNCTEVGGWYVFRKLGIEGMAKCLSAVSERLNLGLRVDIIETEEHFRDVKSKLRVSLDGSEFSYDKSSVTFAEAVRRLGEAEVEGLGMQVSGRDLVSRTGGEGYTPTGGGFYVWTKTNTAKKAALLEEIALSLGKNIHVILEQ